MKSEKKTEKKSSCKIRMQKTKAKLLASYYGHPMRDMKLICITGSTGKSIVAHFVHEILKASGKKAAILASEREFKVSTLHKFLNDAWRAKAEYVVVTAPARALRNNVFYSLPVHVAALTDFIPSTLSDLQPAEYLEAKSTIFQMKPEIVVLNRDDINYIDFAKFSGTKDTITYGANQSALVRIDNSALYRRGTEANLIVGTKNFTTASFLVGEPIISYMACAAAIGIGLQFKFEDIAEGIANYSEEQQQLFQ